MSVSQNIKEARQAASLKQSELAELVGVSENYVTQIETGRKKPSLILIEAISETLSVPISKILAGEHFIEKIRRELAEEAKSAV